VGFANPWHSLREAVAVGYFLCAGIFSDALELLLALQNTGEIRMTHEAGKGDKQRPTDMEEFRKNWQRIFGDKNAPTRNTPKPTDRPHPETKKD
jgi:hypothetical protein